MIEPVSLVAAPVIGVAAAVWIGVRRRRRARRLTHDLRTSLNAIIGFSDMMRRQTVGPMPAVYRDYAENIHGSAVDLLRITEGLTDVKQMPADAFQ